MHLAGNLRNAYTSSRVRILRRAAAWLMRGTQLASRKGQGACQNARWNSSLLPVHGLVARGIANSGCARR